MAQNFLENRLGRYITRTTAGERFSAYVPPPLPPNPSLRMQSLQRLLEQATAALGSLNAVAKLIPDTNLFLYMYVRKEALVSSQIEGTQSSFADLLLFENHETPAMRIDDVEEVSHYIAALNHGIKRMKKNLPLSSRLLRECHGILLRGARGKNKAPGEFRRSQNWIGGTRPGNARFVPPPPEMVADLISDLEKFIHNEDALPALIKIALTHVQFETIHPFLDGNGRLGRLLITLMLQQEKLLSVPILYLSLYFKENRQTYYDLLQEVRLKGDWETWCEFFLGGVKETAEHAQNDAQRLSTLLKRDRDRISHMGRASETGMKLHYYLTKKPYLSITKAAKELKISVPAITNTVAKLAEMGILKERTGKAKNRLFAYHAYLKILAENTEPIQ